MRVVIQRVSKASVTVENEIVGQIGEGLMILVGIENEDTKEDANWLSKKICNLRIFDDEDGVMNKSLLDVKGNILTVSQFTLHAKTKKGNRPSYIAAAKPDISVPLYEYFVKELERESGTKVQTGKFGAHMEVALVNDGPVTIIIDTKNKE
ncbi:D-aminoacyl-tRNA deacylase [Marinifilum caeruleilacunae]|uniref:D-aminoacyl-tRNA deacylase n=1 Tax=Marinifilum caeruleilacunae TaxID=2499076 RepID=A0ABX1WUW5_9BACT|nr:D-aminoacyl-tRNA deacylase [Marinifilum caeruleilacunae]NOU59827.1 D-tyrosyl-tRNA(Tyr) deacylase [Marinifilum caeruleilacunae]